MRARFSRPDATQIAFCLHSIFGGADSLFIDSAHAQPHARLDGCAARLLERWPMNAAVESTDAARKADGGRKADALAAHGAAAAVAASEGDPRRSEHSYKLLWSHLMRFMNRSPEEAVSAVSILEFKTRLSASELENVTAAAVKLTRRLHAATEEAAALIEDPKSRASSIKTARRKLVDVRRRSSRRLQQLDRLLVQTGEPGPLTQDALEAAQKVRVKRARPAALARPLLMTCWASDDF